MGDKKLIGICKAFRKGSDPFPAINCDCGEFWTQEVHTVCPRCYSWAKHSATEAIQSLPITSGAPKPCPMPECGGETEMAFYTNRNVFWIRCKKHPLWHTGPHRETEALALAAWNEPLRKRLEEV